MKTMINGINLYYEVHGNGFPLVLINGIIADHTAWNAVLSALSEQYQVVIFDNRGTGQSDSPDPGYVVEDMAKDVIALMDQLNILEANMIGHSLGGCVGQVLANQYANRFRSVIISDSFPRINASFRIFADVRNQLYKLKASKELLANSILPWALGSAFLEDPKNYQAAFNKSINNPYPQTATGYAGQCHAMLAFDSRKWLHQIELPTLVVVGSDDIVSLVGESEFMAKEIKNAEFKIIKDAGHNPDSEQPSIFLKIVTDFLKKYS